MPKPTGKPSRREKRSQKAQLEQHPHGNEKGVKRKMAAKDSSSGNQGARHDTGLKGENSSQAREIQRLLDSDKNLSAYGLKAQQANNALQITGIVDTLKEKDYLRSLLARAGVRGFVDAVSISTDGQVLDDHVVLEVREELEADPELSGKGITVECRGGTVFLSGNVDNRAQEDRAVAAARKARGVTQVVSYLNFIPGDIDLPSVFHSQVRNERKYK